MVQPTIDDLDRRILEELGDDGRLSFREIGKRMGVTAATVRARFLQLRREGLVEVVAVPNPWRMGFTFFAAVGLRLAADRSNEVSDLLAAHEEVTWVARVATGYDVMCEVALPDAQAFGRYKEEVLAKLPGIQSIDVFVLWEIRKFHYRFASPSAPPTLKADVSKDGGRKRSAAGRRLAAGTAARGPEG